jgi:polar amino acid transport system substrate-binding protein
MAFRPRTTFAVADSQGALTVMTGVTLPSTVEGFAVRKGEPGLLNFLNAWIAYWKADGWLDERRHY